MNKCALAVVITAAATLTGCLDPNYRRPVRQTEPANIPESNADERIKKPAEEPKAVDKKQKEKEDEIVVVKVDEKKSSAAVNKSAPKTPAAEETTVYYVQRGDSLSKISKKFNIKISAIRQMNSLKSDKILIGQKLTLPGKLDVGAAARKPAPSKVSSAAKNSGRSAAPRKITGETKEYVVKNGDTLGHIAVRNGVTVAQLKELNGLSKDSIRVGQKLKIPAPKEKVAKTAPAKEAAAAVKTEQKKPDVKADDVKKTDEKKTEDVAQRQTEEKKPVDPPVAVPPPPAVETMEYVVRDGEDLIGIGLNFDADPAVIRGLNNLDMNDELKAGQKLKIPVKKN